MQHLLIGLWLLISISVVNSLPLFRAELHDVFSPQALATIPSLFPRKAKSSAAQTRIKATTVTQSVNNWVEDVDTVNKFLNVALNLPLGAPLKAGASKALAYANDEPVNNKFLGATKNLDASGVAAAAELDKVFGDVLVQLQRVVSNPLSLPTAASAVSRINVNRCKNVLPSAETLWKSAAVATNTSTSTWPPRANREIICPGN